MISGLILCGGKSTRMGADKGLIKHEASTWAQTAADKMLQLQMPVLLSVNHEQLEQYAQVFDRSLLITDDVSLELKGPLLGVLSAHQQHPDQDFFVLACDMPLMEPDTLKELFHQAEMNPGYDVYVFTNDEAYEPLCAIYKADGLQQILLKLQSSHLERHSMKYVIQQLRNFALPITEAQKIQFRNFNAHAELNGL